MTSLTFYFDPGCPWTWVTSRWLAEAAPRASVDVTWRSFSLLLINEGMEVPEEYRPLVEASRRALRVIESLAAEGRNDDVAAFYAAYGARRFVQAGTPDDDMLLAAAAEAGIDDALARADDEGNDALVQLAFDEIRPIVGTDVGSPAIRVDGTDRAMFGPIVNPAPKGADADRLLEGLLALLDVPGVYELKRSRSGAPDFG